MLHKINLAVAALSLFAGAVQANDLPQYPFVHTDGAASINVIPDVGEIDLEITSADQNAEAAWTQLEARLAAMRTLFAAQGLGADDVDVQTITRTARKQETPASPSGFDTRSTVHVTVRDLSKWAAIVGPLLKMPEVSEFSVVFSRSDRRQLETELVASALADARRKASDMAHGVGRQLGQANGVALVPIRNLSTTFGLSSAEGSHSGPRPTGASDYTLVAAIKLSQSVDVVYKLR